jgi:hypothetical protein
MRYVLKLKKSALVACGLALSIAATAKAATLATYQLLATGSSDSNATISNGGQSITVTQTGATVNLSLVEVLAGSDSNAGNDGVLNVKGSFVGPSSGLLGNFVTATQATGFGGPTSTNGVLINSNNTSPASLNLGDDTTLGTAPTTSSDSVIATSTNSSSNTPTYGTSLDGNGNTDLVIATTTFTLLSSDSSGSGSLTFIPTYAGTGTTGRNQKFTVDGNTYAVNALGSGIENGSTSVTGTLNEIALQFSFSPSATPEPASLSLLGLGGLAMMRRSGNRRGSTRFPGLPCHGCRA